MYVFDGTVSKNFKLSKPVEHFNYDPKIIYELEKQNRYMATRKENGWKILTVVDDRRQISFLTDGINEVMPIKMAHIKAELDAMPAELLPPRTLLVGEIVGNGNTDDRERIISLMTSKNVSEVEEMLQVGPLPHYRLFNLIFLDGKVPNLSYEKTHELLTKMTKSHKYVQPVEILRCSFDEAKARVLREGWEGLVIYDKEFRITFRDDGKSEAKRPDGSWKWKPEAEIDLIALGCRMKDNDPNTVKDLKLYQIDPSNGRYMRCIHYGSFSAAKRKEFSNLPMEKVTSTKGNKTVTGWFKTPFVCQLTIDARKAKTGKLEGSRKFLVREDKNPKECFADKTYPEAEYLDPKAPAVI